MTTPDEQGAQYPICRSKRQVVLINTLPLLEAQSSSEIENIVTTSDRLFRHAQPEHEDQADPATQEALRYRSALCLGLKSLERKPLSTATAVESCRTLMGFGIDIRCPSVAN